jgi:TfoX/Sxy family transcriptional regulator of competence genes
MAFDEDLANRVRDELADVAGLSEKRMFGGLAFVVNGHMAVAASSQGGLLLRCDPAQTGELLSAPHAERFAMRGREMDGWLRIDADGVADEDQLRHWVGIGVAYASSLPPK